MKNHQRLLHRAGHQHGTFNRSQATEEGVGRAMLARAVARGDLVRLSSRVFAVPGSPPTARQAVMAAVLDSGQGAVTSVSTAGALWDLPGFELLPPHLLELRGGSPRRTTLAAAVHTTRVLPAHHVTRLDGIPVVTPTRLLFELSWHVHEGRLARTLDTAWARGLTTGPMLRRALTELGRRGRPLVATMRALIDERGDDHVPPESALEARFVHLLAEDGQPPLRRQVDSGDDHRWLGRIDFRDPDAPFVAQIDSDRYHTALLDREADEAQTAALIAAGYVVRRITEHDIWYRPREMCATVRAGRAEAAHLVDGSVAGPGSHRSAA